MFWVECRKICYTARNTFKREYFNMKNTEIAYSFKQYL